MSKISAFGPDLVGAIVLGAPEALLRGLVCTDALSPQGRKALLDFRNQPVLQQPEGE